MTNSLATIVLAGLGFLSSCAGGSSEKSKATTNVKPEKTEDSTGEAAFYFGSYNLIGYLEAEIPALLPAIDVRAPTGTVRTAIEGRQVSEAVVRVGLVSRADFEATAGKPISEVVLAGNNVVGASVSFFGAFDISIVNPVGDILILSLDPALNDQMFTPSATSAGAPTTIYLDLATRGTFASLIDYVNGVAASSSHSEFINRQSNADAKLPPSNPEAFTDCASAQLGYLDFLQSLESSDATCAAPIDCKIHEASATTSCDYNFAIHVNTFADYKDELAEFEAQLASLCGMAPASCSGAPELRAATRGTKAICGSISKRCMGNLRE